MSGAREYHTPTLTRITLADRAAQRVETGNGQTARPDTRDDHAALCHMLIQQVLHMAEAEQWQQYNGRWCRLSLHAGIPARREYLPDYLVKLAELVQLGR